MLPHGGKVCCVSSEGQMLLKVIPNDSCLQSRERKDRGVSHHQDQTARAEQKAHLLKLLLLDGLGTKGIFKMRKAPKRRGFQ